MQITLRPMYSWDANEFYCLPIRVLVSLKNESIFEKFIQCIIHDRPDIIPDILKFWCKVIVICDTNLTDFLSRSTLLNTIRERIRSFQMLKSSCLSQYKLYFTTIGLPLFFIHDKRLYCIFNNIFYTYIHTHSTLPLTHSYVTISSKTTNTIHYVNTITGINKVRFKQFSTTTELLKAQYKRLMYGNIGPKVLEVS